MKLNVITATSKSSTIEVSDDIFAQKSNPTLIAQAVRVYLSNLRQGTSKTKTRSNVARTKAKWYKQKGTGNARHGSKNAPIFVGGGVSHGPTGLENWTKALSRNMKAQALRVALSMQAEKIVVTDNLNSLSGKTAEAVKILNKMIDNPGRILVVLAENNGLLRRSLDNVEKVLTVPVLEVNALQIASADTVIFTKDSLKAIEARLARSKAVAKEEK
ncbi:MAG: 50S ribosomal protein L4 [Candidatus Pacebacteria bacterium CG10_big_fil_rev_8_21_14_0_10_36_11]|nr:50S ribosomal protein L4 [Candidatus Pacearchaeota archaeon]OIP73702.1 MAG: 50S ribosomal protein L4 [Candidatus Pacebacteria bacterium CG2_30_36_39]PIR64713.1 MAG: 50S ribosomal protein L4 [Candidatus Pacebacteria bacterium CG10_big_fil_rev_8_21_14_0_10_36_11]PJC42336.1 MAG: 50S ribosomal protein L4 [Candidatus Pacebacteria bacterium CG_4_9_14_0_2_um_filter_36_8]